MAISKVKLLGVVLIIISVTILGNLGLNKEEYTTHSTVRIKNSDIVGVDDHYIYTTNATYSIPSDGVKGHGNETILVHEHLSPTYYAILIVAFLVLSGGIVAALTAENGEEEEEPFVRYDAMKYLTKRLPHLDDDELREVYDLVTSFEKEDEGLEE